MKLNSIVFSIFIVTNIVGCRGSQVKGTKQLIKSIDQIQWSKIFKKNADSAYDLKLDYENLSDKVLKELVESIPDLLESTPNIYDLFDKGEPINYKNSEIIVLNYIDFKSSIQYNKSIYIEEEGRYNLLSSKTTGHQWLKLIGEDESLEPTSTIDTLSENELSYYKILNINENAISGEFFTRLVDSIELGYKFELSYVDGDYTQFLDGDVITAKMTSESQKAYDKYIKEYLEKTLIETVKKRMISQTMDIIDENDLDRVLQNYRLMFETEATYMEDSESKYFISKERFVSEGSGDSNFEVKIRQFLLGI